MGRKFPFRLTSLLSALASVMVLSLPAAAGLSFSPVQIVPLGIGGAWYIASADFDNDGFTDIVAAEGFAGRASVLLNNGDGTFERRTIFIEPQGGPVVAVAVGDFNADGKADVAIVTFHLLTSRDSLTILLGNGDGTFVQSQRLTIPGDHERLFSQSIAVGDLTGDDKLSIVTQNTSVWVVLGNGDGTFQAPRGYDVGVAPRSVFIGDFNRDQIPDVAVSNADGAGGLVTILPGIGRGVFGEPVTTRFFPTTDPLAMTAADITGHGTLDLLTTTLRARFCVDTLFCIGGLSVGKGDATFEPLQPIPFDVSVLPPPEGGLADARGIAIGDFNADRIADLVVTVNNLSVPSHDDIYVAEGLGDGTFNPFPLRLNSGEHSGPVTPIVADLDGDGRPDIAFASPGRGVGIFFNRTEPATGKPNPKSAVTIPACQWSALDNGTNNLVYGLTAFDDGRARGLYASGFFTAAGGVAANTIAKWDGAQWSALGSGLELVLGDTRLTALVPALTIFDDGNGRALYAGGDFTRAGGVRTRIAKWDGAHWSAPGNGNVPGVLALAVFDDGSGPALYAGGTFLIAGDVFANYIAKWDGTHWSAVGSGMDHAVFALAVFDDGIGPALYAGGSFTTAGGVAADRIAKWDGTRWSAVGSGMDFFVLALTVFNDGTGSALYAGGSFSTAGGQPANYVAKWDGARWWDVGGGMDYVVRSLTVFDDGSGTALYAGGGFSNAGGVEANRIAKWNGAQWSALGSGMNAGVLGLGGVNDGSGPALYAGGGFTNAGGLAASRIAKWRCDL